MQPAFSPLEGTKITVNNLHPRVTEEDIVVSRFSFTLQAFLIRALWCYAGAAVVTHRGWGVLCFCSQELFCVCGALKRARLVKVGVAEVVFVRKEDAVSAYRKYNNRCLDGEYFWENNAPTYFYEESFFFS